MGEWGGRESGKGGAARGRVRGGRGERGSGGRGVAEGDLVGEW